MQGEKWRMWRAEVFQPDLLSFCFGEFWDRMGFGLGLPHVGLGIGTRVSFLLFLLLDGLVISHCVMISRYLLDRDGAWCREKL
jgi:hypothetical protein